MHLIMLTGKFVGDSDTVMSTEETDSIVHSLQYTFPTLPRNIAASSLHVYSVQLQYCM